MVARSKMNDEEWGGNLLPNIGLDDLFGGRELGVFSR